MFDVVLKARGERILVLGATSGDTGSAAIAALAGPGVGRRGHPLSRRTGVGRAAPPDDHRDGPEHSGGGGGGTFDDCQDLVKAAFSDPALKAKHSLAAVNSINWARVMCQAAYYVWTTAQVGRCSVAVPTGNFGNVLAANVARTIGAPLDRLWWWGPTPTTGWPTSSRGALSLDEVVPTLAPAMDIQVSSNFERYLFDLYDRDADRVKPD
jgi:threonine synthase